MTVSFIFGLGDSIVPFMFFKLNHKILAVLQIILVGGMWGYFYQIWFQGDISVAYFLLPVFFYGSLILATVGWVMYIIAFVKMNDVNKDHYSNQYNNHHNRKQFAKSDE